MQTRYKMIMGLEPLDPNELIEIDEYYEEEIALRRQYLADMRDTVLQTSEEVPHPLCIAVCCMRREFQTLNHDAPVLSRYGRLFCPLVAMKLISPKQSPSLLQQKCTPARSPEQRTGSCWSCWQTTSHGGSQTGSAWPAAGSPTTPPETAGTCLTSPRTPWRRPPSWCRRALP